MSKPPIQANIVETESGIYYPVRLYAVPQAGELIKLFSFIEQADKRPPVRHYEVVQIVHDVHDVTERVSQSEGGHHFVTVFVKPSASEFFSNR
jgi:hypothetical protein